MGGKLQEALPFKGADPRKASVSAGKLKLRRIGRGPGRRVMSHAGKKVLSHGRDLIRPSERAWTAWIGRRVMSHRQRDDITPTKPKTT